MAESLSMIRVGRVERSILLIRGQRVMLDADLAAMFGVVTGRLNEQVRRNQARFPADFAFRLTPAEWDNLKSQIATSSRDWGGRRKLPLAFTEHGCIMAANVLNSPRAVRSSIYIVRAFVQLRELLATNRELSTKLDELERRLDKHDGQIRSIIEAIRELMEPPTEPKRPPIGFRTEAESTKRNARRLGRVRKGR